MLNKKGFTLVELLAVFVVLGVLLAVTIPNIVGITEANRKQTYAQDAKKFKNSVEYRFRGDSTITKPATNGQCIIATLDYVAGSEYDAPPYGGTYLTSQSYVVMVKESNRYKYYVQLVEQLPDGEGYRGIMLKDAVRLNGTDYQNEIDEAVSASGFQKDLAGIPAASATTLKGKKENGSTATLCTSVIKIYTTS